MARYPTYEEYQDKPAKGIARCDELLKRDPSNVPILITKLQLQTTISDEAAADDTLTKICTGRLPTDLTSISTIEEAVAELKSKSYPLPLTAGPDVAKLWDAASKAAANLNHKLDLHSLRFTRAILDNRLQDAQQALIQLKALSPKNKVFYMAHAALTQQLSTARVDLQSRLALSLARKAVAEKFDDEAELDCRVPGQIFALQSSQQDLDSITGRRFADSKQVFEALQSCDAGLEKHKQATIRPEPDTVAPKLWLNAELAALKDSFRNMMTSKQCSEDQLQSFASNDMRLFTTAAGPLGLQTYRPASEAIFLAISAIVKAWTISPTSIYLLQAAFLAESLLRLQPNVHEAKVILVYLYMRLGLGSLAYQHWDDLSIKEIQYDTWGHVFLSRISTIHPHKLIDIDPPRIITHALGVYRRIEDKLAETHASVLSHGQTGMIFDLFGLRNHLQLSITRRLLSLEQRRLARLHNKAADEKSIAIVPRLTSAWLDVKDNRDFSAAFDFGFNLERALHAQDEVQNWMLFSLAADALWCLMHNQLALVTDTAALLTVLERVSEQGSMNDHEWLVGETITSLLQIALNFVEGKPVTGMRDTLLAAIDSLHIDLLMHDNLPMRIGCVYLYIDTLRIVSAFGTFAGSKGGLDKEDAKTIRHAATAAFSKLQDYGRTCFQSCNAREVEDMLSKSIQHQQLYQELQNIGAEELTRFSTSVARSCQDAWAGVAQYKL